MTKIFCTLFIAMLGIGLHAQKIYQPASPSIAAVVDDVVSFSENQFVQPQIQREKDVLGPYIAAQTALTNLNESNLVWQMNSEGIWIGTMSIDIKNAQSINVLFTDVVWPRDAKLFFIGENTINGPFTTDNFTSSTFSHFPIEGSQLQLHIELSAVSKENLHFKISEVNAAFNESMRDGGCNVASICPTVDAYRKAQKSTVIISVNGSGFCTGTLINNSSRDDTPLVITAQHCLTPSRNLSNWVFAFNYEATACNTPNVNNGKSFSLRGADVVAENSNSDFALLLLRENLGPNDSTHFAGWDKSDISPTSQYVFHHPNGALKRFSFNANTSEKTTYLESNNPPFVWKIDKWESGTTEGGSSGSSLMNLNGQVMGTLVGGAASCTNVNGSDYFGRLAIGFEDNVDESKSLDPWLDPNSGNYDTLAGYDYPRSNVPNIDLSIRKISGLSSSSCDGKFAPKIVVKNVGKLSVSNYTLNIQSAGMPTWIPNETIQTIAPGQSISYTFTERTYPAGIANFVLNLNTENDAYTKNNQGYKQSTVLQDAIGIQMSVTLDDYGNENYWELYNIANERIVFDGPFKSGFGGTTIDKYFCLEEGCYRLEFTDSYGDGMCCDFGNGSFILTSSTQDTLAFGYNGPTNLAGDSETQTVNFCITANGIEDNRNLKNLSIAPNPTSIGQRVKFQNIEAPIQFQILGLDGKVILSDFSDSFLAPNMPGVYLIQTEGFVIQKLLVY